jgi:protein phosphatase
MIKIQCVNPDCLHTENHMGRRLCDRCQTPLTYRYLWAVGDAAGQIPLGTLVENRYAVISAKIWLDTQPVFKPIIPSELPDLVQPYLNLYFHRLHLPELYGFAAPGMGMPPVILLENAPIDTKGRIQPSLESMWMGASAARQLNWLYQLLMLWQPLQQFGMAHSLLAAQNIRVEGWRVRLRELIPDDAHQPTLKDLAETWLDWMENAHPRLVQPLKDLCRQMQATTHPDQGFAEASGQLNQLLLQQASQLPLRLQTVGGSSVGPQRSHNEDACFPANSIEMDDVLSPFVGIVCDGIGGHEGGEVASKLALDSLRLQLKYFLMELADEPEPLEPHVIEQQLTAIVRVANNVIASRNDEQQREHRRRMGTTLMLALQLPQRLKTEVGDRNSHELYLVHIGDSRAYWITPRYCHRLTLDDDVATREISLGRMIRREAIARPDGGALTQALGTRSSELLYPTVQRFIVEEDGVLLLCSDGLSDGDRVEQLWSIFTEQVLQGELTLEEGIQFWLEAADALNGHDNSSVVMMHCQVDEAQSTTFNFKVEPPPPVALTVDEQYEDLAVSSIALLYDEDNRYAPDLAPELSDVLAEIDLEEAQPRGKKAKAAKRKKMKSAEVQSATSETVKFKRKGNPILASIAITTLLLIGGVASLGAWHHFHPKSFWQAVDRVLGSEASESQPGSEQQE